MLAELKVETRLLCVQATFLTKEKKTVDEQVFKNSSCLSSPLSKQNLSTIYMYFVYVYGSFGGNVSELEVVMVNKRGVVLKGLLNTFLIIHSGYSEILRSTH